MIPFVICLMVPQILGLRFAPTHGYHERNFRTASIALQLGHPNNGFSDLEHQIEGLEPKGDAPEAIKKSVNRRTSASTSSPTRAKWGESGYASIPKFQVISLSLIRFTVGLPPPFSSPACRELVLKSELAKLAGDTHAPAILWASLLLPISD
jgi:hypothetical protein